MNRVGGGGGGCMHRICILGIPQSSVLPTIHNTVKGGGRGRLRILKNFEEVGRLRSFKN